MSQDANETPQPDPNPAARRGFIWWLWWIVIILLVTGFVITPRLDAQAARRYPPPGEMIAVNDHHLHLYCIGERQAGVPTVILEAGGGGYSLDWSLVQPEVARFARVCAYDRAGFGWSEAGRRPRDVQRLAAELHTLLERSGEPGPYLLVGASFGGLIVQVFAYQHPDEVAGLVLVDTPHPDWNEQAPGVVQQAQSSTRQTMGGLSFLKRIGLLDLANALGLVPTPAAVQALPADLQPTALAIGYRIEYWKASQAEALAQRISFAFVKTARPLPDVPLIVLAHSRPEGLLPPGLRDNQATQAEQTWQALQADLARLTPQGQLIVVEDSGHLIALEQPGAVVEAVRQVVEGAGK